MNNKYYNKYLKYYNKYKNLQKQLGGNIEYTDIDDFELKYITVSNLSELIKISKFNRVNFIKNNSETVIDKSKVIFYFGHFDDDLSNYRRILRFFNGHIVYFYDYQNTWYENLLEPFKQYIINNFSDIDNYIFMGPSMGGYASLYMSVQFPEKKCICIALGAQTFQLDKKIYLHDNLDYLIPDRGYNTSIKIPFIHQTNIKKDIADLLKENPDTNTKIYLINSKFECHPDCFDSVIYHEQFIFLDNLHAGAIINFDNVKLILYNSNDHAIGSNINLKDIFSFVSNLDNFNILYENQIEGVNLLKNNINPFVKTVPSTPASVPASITPSTFSRNLISALDSSSPTLPIMTERKRTVSFSDGAVEYPKPTTAENSGAAASGIDGELLYKTDTILETIPKAFASPKK